MYCLFYGIIIIRIFKNIFYIIVLYFFIFFFSFNLEFWRLYGMNFWMRLWRKVMVFIERGVFVYRYWNGNIGNICIICGFKGLLVGCMVRRYYLWFWYWCIWIIYKKMLFYGMKLLVKYRKIWIDLIVLKVLFLGGRGWRNEFVFLIFMVLRDWIILVFLWWIFVRCCFCLIILIIWILLWIYI